ncbi:MAG: hypothetical protein AB7P69_20325 [Candidatus Binatia bacterium]
MRMWGVLLCVIIAGVAGGLGGDYWAARRCNKESARLTQERDLSLLRERELRGQLEEALAARAALAQEVQQLQLNLSERLKRLEEIAAPRNSSAPEEESPPQ